MLRLTPQSDMPAGVMRLRATRKNNDGILHESEIIVFISRISMIRQSVAMLALRHRESVGDVDVDGHA
jgi:hypothetical protein